MSLNFTNGPIVILELQNYIYDLKLFEEVGKSNFWYLITVLEI